MPQQIERIDPVRAALIVVDMENEFVKPGASFEVEAGRAMLPKLKEFIGFYRQSGIAVIYTTHVHRSVGSAMGRFADIYPPIAEGTGLVDGTDGIEIYDEIAPEPGEVIIKKHRYSAFFGTDLDIILRGLGTDTVIVTGVTTENCCHATARDAMFHDCRIAFLSDCTAATPSPTPTWATVPPVGGRATPLQPHRPGVFDGACHDCSRVHGESGGGEG